MNDHPLVTDVFFGGPARDRREVEHPERTREDHRGHSGVGNDLRVGGLHHPENPLAAAPRAVVALLHRPQRERDGCAEHEHERDQHGQHHVTEHVHAEQVLLVGVERTVRRVEEQREAGYPGDRAADRPLVAAAMQPPHAREIHEHAEDTDEGPGEIELPLGEVARGDELCRERIARQVLCRACVQAARLAGRLERDRGGGAAEGSGETARGAHHGELSHNEPGEHFRAPLARNTLDRALPPQHTEHAERDERRGLQHHDLAVAGGEELVPGTDTHPSAHDARCGDADEGEECERAVARDEHRESRSIDRLRDEDEGDQAAEPDRRADEMHEQRVDRLRVVRCTRRVSLRGNRKRGRERHDEGHEHESAIPHREAQHRCYRREQNLRKPIAAELNRRQELGEPGTKGCATRERQP